MSRLNTLHVSATLLAICLSMTPAAIADPDQPANERTIYTLKTAVIGAAGAPGTSPGFTTTGTLAQPSPVGAGIGGEKRLYSGFWPAFQRLAWLTDAVAPEILASKLLQNFPNPFNPATTIEYVLASAGTVNVAIFDIKGRRIRTLVDANQPHGRYQVIWNGRDDRGSQVASGLYMCRMKSGQSGFVMKMLVLK